MIFINSFGFHYFVASDSIRDESILPHMELTNYELAVCVGQSTCSRPGCGMLSSFLNSIETQGFIAAFNVVHAAVLCQQLCNSAYNEFFRAI
jgi:hypothetical protein